MGNQSSADAREQVVNFVRRYVYLKREGFLDGWETPDIVQYLDWCEPIILFLVDRCHVEPAEAREAYSRILLNGAEDKFKLPAVTAA